MRDAATLHAERSLNADRPASGETVPLAIGSEINGRYRVEALLGHGGMGVVYRVTDALHPARRVALKVVRGGSMSASQVGLFKAEFKITAAFKHPNIAEVFDFEPMIGTDDYLFTMAFIDGRDLFSATRGASPAEIVGLVVQVLRALSYVHSRQVIHFDLKPANILVDEHGCVKVLDFGLAGLSSAARSSHALFGTPAYMAPELLKSGGSADHRADLYSLGIVAYQLLCGRLPFTGADLRELFGQHASQLVVFPPDSPAPDWLKAIILRLTAKEPSDRHRSANTVIEALSAAGGVAYDLETSETRESYILSSRFVGREQPLSAILRFIEERTRAHAASPAAWFVRGESGVGKSRLMREVRHQVQMSRVAFAEASCYERGVSEYAPIAEILRFAVRLAEAAGGGAMVARFAPVLARIAPGIGRGVVAAVAGDNPEAERLKLIDCAAEFLIAVSSLSPFVLYVNDLQWAEPGTVDLIAYLLQLVAQRESAGQSIPIAVTGSFRDDEVEGRPIAGLLASLRETGLKETALGPLTAEEVHELVCSMLGISTLPGEFVERVAREAAGAPFFVEEVMRTLVENGSVFLQDGAWAASRRILELEIPSSMTQVFLRRFSFLDDASRTVLELLASSARPTAPEVLEEVAGLQSQVFHQALASLVQKRMVSLEDERYRPTHDRMREGVYGSLPEEQRQTIHARFGEAIERRYAAALDEHVFELAHHFGLSTDRDKGLAYSLRAGDKAKLQYSNHLGIELYRRALELLGEGDAAEQERVRLNEKLGDLCYLTGQYEQCPQRYEAALGRTEAPLKRARLYRKLGQLYHVKGDHHALFDTLWSAAELLGGRRPRGTLGKLWLLTVALASHAIDRFFPFLRRPARSAAERERLLELSAVYLRLSYAYYFIDPLGGIFVALLGLSASERAGVSTELCHSLSATNVLYAILHFYRRAEAFGARAMAMAEQLGSAWHVANTHALFGMTKLCQGDWRAGETYLRKAVTIFNDCGDVFELTAHYSNLIRCLFYQGRMRETAAATQDSLDISQRSVGRKHYLPSQLMQQGIVLVKLGRPSEGVAEIRRSIAVAGASTVPDTFLLCQGNMWLGDALLDCGQTEEAVACLDEARRLREEHGHITHEISPLYSLLARAELRAVPGETPASRAARLRRASKRARKALRLAGGSGHLLAPALLAVGLCDWENGKPARARERFRRSMAVAEQQGARYLLAQAHHYSGLCFVAGDERDRDEGLKRLREATRLYRECGMELDLAA